ncbi:hypothetical protein [Methylocystis heyeri]|uniref:Uncharacterized protein n=1 Tax=Methylocystis heyeri TaxID=391905 RepID=A0A6B8KD71_9HYPH|nr:hypothetical protein [Methylocystis heyeri]QGM44961.1 hypothetical protein H2LOC_004250 [Methylocystis heyeri]
MSKDEMQQLISALELFEKNLEYPMYLGSVSEDRFVRQVIGEFAAKIIADLNYDIIPKLKAHAETGA